MTIIFRRTASVLMAFLLVVLAVSLPTFAQTDQESGVANGFRISPVRTEYIIDKGKSQALTITIENPTDSATVAKAVVNDFISSENESGEPRLILDENTQPPKNSIKTLVGRIEDVPLAPKEKKDISVTIRVPENANSGGYYGAIRFVPADIGQVDTVGLSASVGTLILVRVPGNLSERLDMVEFSAAQDGKAKTFFTGGNVQSMIRLKNEGDIHLQPFGRVSVKNMFGKEVASYELNNEDLKDNILPGSTRKFVDDLQNQKWLGRYSITANLGYNNGGNLISSSTSFWYMPIWSIVVLLVIVLAIAWVAYYLYRRYSLPRPKHGVKKN